MVARIGATVLLVLVGLSALLVPSATRDAEAATGFLTFPFPRDPAMHLQQAWTSSFDPRHFGIDYIKGTIDDAKNPDGTDKWQTFQVLASAAGEAEWVENASDGKYVFITHRINGATFYTYYGHLASVAAGIPARSTGQKKHVEQGEYIGQAGKSGQRSNGYLHLHFALKNSADAPIDPYGLNLQRPAYPQPNAASGTCGQNSFWVSCTLPFFGPACPNPNPGPNQVALFEQPNFLGRCTVKDFGLYPSANALGINSVSSFKLGDGAVIGFYADTDYRNPRGYYYGPVNIASRPGETRVNSARVSHNAVVFTAVRASTSTRLPNACWFVAKDGDFFNGIAQCDAWRGDPDGTTPFGAAARGLLGLVPGNYRAREYIAPSGYQTVAEFSFTVADGQVTRLTVPHNPSNAGQSSSGNDDLDTSTISVCAEPVASGAPSPDNPWAPSNIGCLTRVDAGTQIGQERATANPPPKGGPRGPDAGARANQDQEAAKTHKHRGKDAQGKRAKHQAKDGRGKKAKHGANHPDRKQGKRGNPRDAGHHPTRYGEAR